MIFIVSTATGRLIPIGFNVIDDFGNFVFISPDAQKQAWYFLGVIREF